MKANHICFTICKAIVGAGLMMCLTSVQAANVTNSLFGITQTWKYNTNNLSSANWKAIDYDETGWISGSALFYIESNASVTPRNTALPTRDGTRPYLTYYFRTTFNFVGDPEGFLLIFTNRVDDGVVYYLNGTELQRLRMPRGTVSYTTGASGTPPGGDATSPDVFMVTPTNLVSGINVLAAEVHQTDSTSSDIVFGTSLTAVKLDAASAQITRGPYLQIGTPTSIIVGWRTDSKTDSRVIYGNSPANLTFTNDLSALTTEHEVLLSGLRPDTRYYYAVGNGSAILTGGDTNTFFVTSPLPGVSRPTRIWIIGDAGKANANQAAVRDAYYNFTGSNHTHLWLQLGDNAYETGTDAEYQAAVFNMYSALLRKSVTWSTLGNHETAQSTAYTTNYPYFALFTLPANGEAGGVASGTEHYYSFDYGNIHFVCLDSMTADRATNGAMANWLRADLASTTNAWLIAFWHHPPYTKGSHDSDNESGLIEMRQNFLPILEDGGVDLVLSGHSHSYERSYLINGHYGLSGTFTNTMIVQPGSGRGTGAYVKPEGGFIGNQGAVYAVAGCSGQISGGALNHPAMYVSLNQLGSMVLDVTSNRLDAIFLRETGASNDWFSIVKANYAPAASNLLVTVKADASTNLTLRASDINRQPLTFMLGNPPTNGLISNFDPTNGTFTYTPARGANNGDAFQFRVNDGKTNSSFGNMSIAIQPPLDSNTNGLADDWETFYGVSNPNSDADGDGMSNIQEYRAGTNPNEASSWLKVSRIDGDANGHFTLTWPSIGGVRYRVLYSDGDLNGNFDWIFTPVVRSVNLEMAPGAVGSLSTMSFEDDFTLTGGSSGGHRFYRIMVVR